jgi:hypothetical protein
MLHAWIATAATARDSLGWRAGHRSSRTSQCRRSIENSNTSSSLARRKQTAELRQRAPVGTSVVRPKRVSHNDGAQSAIQF